MMGVRDHSSGFRASGAGSTSLTSRAHCLRGVQKCTTVNAQGASSPLKLLLTGFFFISSIIFTITNFFLLTPGGFSLVPNGLAGAIYFTTPALAASGILTFLLVTLLILCLLSVNKLLNLIALLKVLALGPMDFSIQTITLPSFFGHR